MGPADITVDNPSEAAVVVPRFSGQRPSKAYDVK
jgi:hypothetical protein